VRARVPFELPVLAIAIPVALVLHAGALRSSFVLDDFAWLECAADARAQLGHVLTLHISHFFRPLPHLLFAGLSAAAGARPLPFHLASLTLHLLCATLLARLALRLTVDRVTAWLAALAFVVMPAHGDAVLWASAISEPLGAALLLAALLGWARFLDPAAATAVHRRGYTLSLASLLLALGCRESAITTAPLLALLHLALAARGRARQVSWRVYLPPAALLAAYLGLQLWLQRASPLVSDGSWRLGLHAGPQLVGALGLLFSLFWAPLVALLVAMIFRPSPAPTRATLRAALLLVSAAVLALLPYTFFRFHWSALPHRYFYVPSLAAALGAALALRVLLAGGLAARVLGLAAGFLLAVGGVHLAAEQRDAQLRLAARHERFFAAALRLPAGRPVVRIQGGVLEGQQLRAAMRLRYPHAGVRFESGRAAPSDGEAVWRWDEQSGQLHPVP